MGLVVFGGEKSNRDRGSRVGPERVEPKLSRSTA
jgi:hypothetical protein